MKAYRFAMESVLGWREDLEKHASEKYSIKNEQIREKDEKIKKLTAEYQWIKEETLQCKSATALQQIQNYKTILAQTIENEMGQLQRLHMELEELRGEWTQTRMDKTAMEKLKERDHDRYKEKLKIQERNQLDEVAISRHYRKEG